MSAANKLVPRLRFPEFRDAGNWDRFNGNKLFAQINDRNHNGELPVLAITQEHGAIPRDLIDYNVSVMQSSIDSYKIVREGDFIISLRSFQGGIEFSNYEGLCSPAYVILREKRDTDAHFFKHLFKSKHFICELTKNLEGLRDGKMISYKQFSEVLINLPSKPEQQKIADCLGSLDDRIAAEGRKLAALREHKKGLMQQFFPIESETKPHLRFPEFRDAGEWKASRLAKQVASLDAGVSALSGDRPALDDEFGVLKTSCVTDGTFRPEENKVVSAADQLSRVSEPVQADTIIMSRMNTVDLVGANAYVERAEPNLFLPDRLWAVKANSDGNMRFLSYVLGSVAGRQMLSSLAKGSSGSMKNIKKSEVLGLEFAVPEPAEQQRIADCLSALDGLITAQREQIATLKEHKKGLMQKLFPYS